MFKGIIFDLDGILVDTEYYQWRGWVEVLKPLGIMLSKEDYFNYAGKRGDIIEEQLVKKYDLKIKKGELLSEKEKMLLNWFEKERTKLMPYAKEAVRFLLSQKIKVAVASGGPKDEVILKLNKIGFYSLFPVIVSGTDIKRGKPFPDIYLYAVKKLNLKPKECIAFEDTQYGIESAKSAGLYCIAIPGEFSIKQDFSKADKVFKNLHKAINYLESEQ